MAHPPLPLLHRLLQAQDSLHEKEQDLRELASRMKIVKSENLLLEEKNRLLIAVHSASPSFTP